MKKKTRQVTRTNSKKTPNSNQSQSAKKKVGRPSGFTTKVEMIMKQFVSNDVTISNELLADLMGIKVNTLYVWMNTNDEFIKSYNEAVDNFYNGKGVQTIQNKILKSALGYVQTEKTIKITKNEEGKIIKEEVTESEKTIPPNNGALGMILNGTGRTSQLLKKSGLGEEESGTKQNVNIQFNVADAKDTIQITKGEDNE